MAINIGEMTTDVTVEDGASGTEGRSYAEGQTDEQSNVCGAMHPPLQDNRRTAAENYDD